MKRALAAAPLLFAIAMGLWVLSPQSDDSRRDAAGRSGPDTRVGGKGGRIVRILGIGNSFTEDAVNDYLHELATAGGHGVVVARLTIGAATLEEHLENARSNKAAYGYSKRDQFGVTVRAGGKSLAEAVKDEDWDFICFQQQSWLAGQFDSYEPYLPALVEIVKAASTNPDARYAVLQTWAFAKDYALPDFRHYGSDQLTMHAALVDAVKRASALITPGLIVIPAGTAIQNGRTSRIGDAFCRDGYHLNLAIGRFTVACAWYQAAFGDAVVDNPYLPRNIPGDHAALAKRAAWHANANPDEITDLSETP